MVSEDLDQYLIGVRLRETVPADDYKLVGMMARVGDLVLVETGTEPVVGEVRRPRRPVPEHKRDQLYRRVVRLATDHEAREYRERREREKRGIMTAQGLARSRSVPLKVLDVEMHPTARRVTIYFGSEERVDFRELRRWRGHDREGALAARAEAVGHRRLSRRDRGGSPARSAHVGRPLTHHANG